MNIQPSPLLVQVMEEKPVDLQLKRQSTHDNISTLVIDKKDLTRFMRFLKFELVPAFEMLYDLTAIDERNRKAPENDFTIVYHLLSYSRNEDLRVKVPLFGEFPSLSSITDIWPSAQWYEREVWDMFGIRFDGHAFLKRILMPPWWQGHPLRKEHPSRATEMKPYQLSESREQAEQEELQFRPQEWDLRESADSFDYLFLNMGPQHPGTHGAVRIILQLEGEAIRNSFMDIGYHHRAAEKMGERQTWHTYIPYTDRVDYLGGVTNNFPYVMAVERLAGIEVPDRVKVIRVMMAELFRIASHLVYYGTFAQDVGALSPVFYMFTDRERIFEIVEAITGGRMHPSWFRIGGVAHDLPIGWEQMVRKFLEYLPPRLAEYDQLVMKNRIFKARTQGIGLVTKEEAIEWGMTGPNLRACGFEWDYRKKRPYSGYDEFDFEVPTAQKGDCYGRASIRVEEIRQSLKIIEQCMKNMPAGAHKADHPLTTPPLKAHTLHDIETLITHFLGVSWGPVIPEGEASVGVEGTKGMYSYYLTSDGNTNAYRVRIRTPSFPHLQMIPRITQGLLVPDLLAILGSIDFVMGEVDR